MMERNPELIADGKCDVGLQLSITLLFRGRGTCYFFLNVKSLPAAWLENSTLVQCFIISDILGERKIEGCPEKSRKNDERRTETG